MAGVDIQINTREVLEINEQLKAMSGFDARPLMRSLAAELQSQTQNRIVEEKASPEGEAWKPWAEEYALTRHQGNSLLRGEGRLFESIQAHFDSNEAESGTNVIYGAIHQFGGEPVGMPIPARPYMGISDENYTDLSQIITNYVVRLIND